MLVGTPPFSVLTTESVLSPAYVGPFARSSIENADVERVDLSEADEIVAVCRRGKSRQRIPILDLPLPVPRPAGAEWIEAYRYWARGGRP